MYSSTVGAAARADVDDGGGQLGGGGVPAGASSSRRAPCPGIQVSWHDALRGNDYLRFVDLLGMHQDVVPDRRRAVARRVHRRLSLRAPSPPKQPDKNLKGPVRRAIVGIITFVGLVATTIASVYVGVYTLLPDLKPREKLGATIDHIVVEHGVEYYEYARRMGYNNDPEAMARHAEGPGDMVFIRVSLAGFKDRSYAMGVMLIDADGRQAFPRPVQEGKASATCENLSPSANEDGISWRCWILSLSPGTKYRIRSELYDSGVAAEIKEGPIKDYRALLDFSETGVLTSPPETTPPPLR